MGRELVIGLDLGTTSVKAVLFNLAGDVVNEEEQMISSNYPQPGWVEQDPLEIERGTVKVLKNILSSAKISRGELLAVGISCAMHSIICVDDNMEAISPMLIWADGRASNQAEELRTSDGKNIYARTGTPIHPMSPFTKLLWMKETMYEPYKKATYFMSMKEFLLEMWFGKRVVDFAMASATGMLNLKTLDWDEETLSLTGVTKDQLSTIVSPTEILTEMDPIIQKEIGFTEEVPFVIGSADGQLANLGSGAISPGEVAISAGTSGAIRQFVQGTPIDSNQETFTYAFSEELSIVGGPTNNGGIALQWVKDLLEFEGSHDELLAGAEKISPGAEGIFFHPYVNGERAPLWNQRAKGNFFGLTMVHKKEHLVRSVLEGITFNIYQIGQTLESLAGKPTKISVNGGLTRSPLWVQILADVFGQSVYVSDTHHNAAWGAAWTALVAIQKVDSFEEIKQNLPKEQVIEPNMKNHAIYKEIYKKYEAIGNDLAKYFTE